MVIQSANYARGEHVGLRFRIGPKNIMAHLVINGVDPTSFGVILSSVLPIFRMDQLDLAVFIGLAGGLSPVQILKPLYVRILQMIKTAKRRDGSFEILRLVLLEKAGKQAIDNTPLF